MHKNNKKLHSIINIKNIKEWITFDNKIKRLIKKITNNITIRKIKIYILY